MKRTIKIVSGAVVAVFLFVAIFIIFPVTAQAGPSVPVAGAKFNVSSSLKDNLKIYLGKDVLIHLRSGKTFQGYVKSVDDNFAHLEKLSGKDFYDVLIRIEDISAIEAKFRDTK
jgi:small nuclear ribonucleoprotein (snRNP)-like protein